MEKRKHLTTLLFITITSLAALLYIVFSLSPSNMLIISRVQFSIITVFFLVLFVFLFSVITYFLKILHHGILVALFVITYLLLRLHGLTNPFFAGLLLTIFLTLEFVFTSKDSH